MTYDPRTLLERYRLASELSPDGEQPECPLCASGLPPGDLADCVRRGCRLNCWGLGSVARLAMSALGEREMPSNAQAPVTSGATMTEPAVPAAAEASSIDGNPRP